MRKLKLLKIHDPELHEKAYNDYRELIEELYGKDRTYDDFTLVFNCFRQCPT